MLLWTKFMSDKWETKVEKVAAESYPVDWLLELIWSTMKALETQRNFFFDGRKHIAIKSPSL